MRYSLCITFSSFDHYFDFRVTFKETNILFSIANHYGALLTTDTLPTVQPRLLQLIHGMTSLSIAVQCNLRATENLKRF